MRLSLLLLLSAATSLALDDSAAECFATAGCHSSADVDLASSLLRESCAVQRPVLAHFLVGPIASWSTQSVYESFAEQAVGAAPWAAHDVYLCVGKESSDARPASAWRASLAQVNVVAVKIGGAHGEEHQKAQLEECLALAQAAEAAAGCKYAAVLRSSPSLRWDAPVPPTLQAASAASSVVLAEAAGGGASVALCPRPTVSVQDPCCAGLPGCTSTGVADAGGLFSVSVVAVGSKLSLTPPAAASAASAASAPPAAPPADASVSSRALGGGHGPPQRVAMVLVGRPKQDKYEYGLFFESYRARVIDKYRRQGHTVDVFLCSKIETKDSLGNLVLRRLEPYTVFDVEAKTQFERQDKCYVAIREASKAAPYDWYFRSRPDLVLWDDAPDLEGLDTTLIHARVLSAFGVDNLFYGSFSYDWEASTCWPDVCLPGDCAAPDAPCAVYDDQLALVPRAVADVYFIEVTNKEGHAPWVPNGKECEWTRGGFPEHFFMRNTMAKGGRFTGLNLESRLLGYKGEIPKRENEGKPKPCPHWSVPPAAPARHRRLGDDGAPPVAPYDFTGFQ